MRLEIASYTDAGLTQRLPGRIAQKCSRRSVQFDL